MTPAATHGQCKRIPGLQAFRLPEGILAGGFGPWFRVQVSAHTRVEDSSARDTVELEAASCKHELALCTIWAGGDVCLWLFWTRFPAGFKGEPAHRGSRYKKEGANPHDPSHAFGLAQALRLFSKRRARAASVRGSGYGRPKPFICTCTVTTAARRR